MTDRNDQQRIIDLEERVREVERVVMKLVNRLAPKDRAPITFDMNSRPSGRAPLHKKIETTCSSWPRRPARCQAKSVTTADSATVKVRALSR